MSNGKRWRVAPRPAGFYRAYLDDLIERNRHKRGTAEDDAKEDEYWNRRREFEALKDQPKKAA
jgi:hypothetical protein